MPDEVSPQVGPSADRLESWKEIAAYLRRDVRTVQRWEQTDGLPVHRHARGQRAIPYAYKAELDGWWTGQVPDAPTLADGRARRSLVPVVTTAVALAIVGTVLLGARSVSTAVRGWVRSGRSKAVSGEALVARRLYTQADALIRASRSDEAEALLRHATAADPAFGSAYVLLALALRDQNKPPAEYVPIVMRAEQLAGESSESERLFIHGTLLEMTGHEADACAAFDAVVTIKPDHYWAVNNAAGCYFRAGLGANAASLFANRADLNPESIDDNVMAAWANEFVVSNPSVARRYLARAEQLRVQGKYEPNGTWSDAWLTLLPAYRRWLANDIDGAAAQLNAAVAVADRLDPYRRDDLLKFAGMFRMTLGQLVDAEQLFGRVTKDRQLGYLAFLAYARGDQDGARRLFLGFGRPPLPRPASAIVMVRLGLGNVAEAFLSEGGAAGGGTGTILGTWMRDAIAGQLALKSGNIPRGLDRLSHVVIGPGLRSNDPPTYFIAAEGLARALAQTGAVDDALSALEVAAIERSHSYHPGGPGPLGGYFWLRLRLLQAELYGRRGRAIESRRAAAELVRLLAHADPDFPILVRARQLLNH